jgi:hypothetical protein
MVYASDEVHVHLGGARPEATGPFGQEEMHVASLLAPHISRAMVVYHRFYGLRKRCEELVYLIRDL